MHVVQKMLEVAEVKKGDILYDMGSGDGRIVIEAAKHYGVSGVGIDLNAELVAKARENAANEGVSHLVEFRAQDGLTVDISGARWSRSICSNGSITRFAPSCRNSKPDLASSPMILTSTSGSRPRSSISELPTAARMTMQKDARCICGEVKRPNVKRAARLTFGFGFRVPSFVLSGRFCANQRESRAR